MAESKVKSNKAPQHTATPAQPHTPAAPTHTSKGDKKNAVQKKSEPKEVDTDGPPHKPTQKQAKKVTAPAATSADASASSKNKQKGTTAPMPMPTPTDDAQAKKQQQQQQHTGLLSVVEVSKKPKATATTHVPINLFTATSPMENDVGTGCGFGWD